MVRGWKVTDQRELGSQLIRASNSIHANIAEGYGKSPQGFKRYLDLSLGSCDEVCSHLTDALNVGLISQESYNEFITKYEIVGKQLTKLKQNWK